MLMTIILVVLVLALLGGIPRAGAYNAGWGYGPSGVLGLIVVVLVILALLGKIHI
jgi:hypothetical protein